MAQSENNLIYLKIDKSLVDLSNVLANARIKFEYDRMHFSINERIKKISVGYLGELLASAYFTSINIPFLHFINVGDFDKGYDFVIGSNFFDVKTTVFKRSYNSIDSFRKISYENYHLYVARDQGQFEGSKADYYVQVLITYDKANALLCGYTKKENLKPSYNTNNLFPAMEVPIMDLTPMEKMSTDENLIPRCYKCGSVFISGQQPVEYQIAQSLMKHGMVLCSSCINSFR